MVQSPADYKRYPNIVIILKQTQHLWWLNKTTAIPGRAAILDRRTLATLRTTYTMRDTISSSNVHLDLEKTQHFNMFGASGLFNDALVLC